MAKVDDLLNYSGRWAEYEVSRVVATNNKSRDTENSITGLGIGLANSPKCVLSTTHVPSATHPSFAGPSCYRFRLVIFPYKKTLTFFFPASQATNQKNRARLKNNTKTLILQANAPIKSKMLGQRLLILTLVAGLLLIQLTPMAQAKPSKNRNAVQLRESTGDTDTETETETETETDEDTDTDTDDDDDDDDDDDVDAVECLIGIANFVIGQFNALFPGILLGVSTCITVCDGGDAAACVACVAAAIPAIPLIPTSIAGCG